jgi:hypothetical protein
MPFYKSGRPKMSADVPNNPSSSSIPQEQKWQAGIDSFTVMQFDDSASVLRRRTQTGSPATSRGMDLPRHQWKFLLPY